MCISMPTMSQPTPPPLPEPIPETPPRVSNATTTQDAPKIAQKRDSSGSVIDTNDASSASKKRVGRGSLRIPLSGMSGSGVNFPRG
ncbi:MAG: hypothetical protein O2871_02960 [bacterium]|nr:hypothetical protein [bacterium]